MLDPKIINVYVIFCASSFNTALFLYSNLKRLSKCFLIFLDSGEIIFLW